jgi:hypothetical protein
MFWFSRILTSPEPKEQQTYFNAEPTSAVLAYQVAYTELKKNGKN